MKHFALLVSILSITFSCANQKSTNKKSISDSAQINKEIQINKPKFAPNTIALNIKISEIITHDNYYEIISSVEKRLGSGAGIIGVYTKGKDVSFKTNQELNFKINSSYKLLFKEIQKMSNKGCSLSFIKEIK
tara:strand:+ start:2494 stop:2892 length:399 start_codon:yes stop_codon:yes gene_type:complete